MYVTVTRSQNLAYLLKWHLFALVFRASTNQHYQCPLAAKLTVQVTGMPFRYHMLVLLNIFYFIDSERVVTGLWQRHSAADIKPI